MSSIYWSEGGAFTALENCIYVHLGEGHLKEMLKSVLTFDSKGVKIHFHWDLDPKDPLHSVKKI